MSERHDMAQGEEVTLRGVWRPSMAAWGDLKAGRAGRPRTSGRHQRRQGG